MKLYDRKTSFHREVTLESFVRDYATLKVVSAESAHLFLSKVQDSFRSVAIKLDPEHERFRQDAWMRQRAATARAKEISFNQFRHERLSKPESFKGYYTEYLKDLYQTSFELSTQCTVLVETLQMALGVFINENVDDKVTQIYGRMVFEGAAKKLPALQKALAGYFKAPAGQVKSLASELLRSMQDIETLYSLGEQVSRVYTPGAVQDMERKVSATADLVDALVQVNLGNGVLTRYAHGKQQLVEAIHVTAKYVECYHAALAHWVFYCKCFNDLTEQVVQYESQSVDQSGHQLLQRFEKSLGLATEGIVTGVAGDVSQTL